MDEKTQILSLEFSVPPKPTKRLQRFQSARKAIIVSGLFAFALWGFVGAQAQWEGGRFFGRGCSVLQKNEKLPAGPLKQFEWTDIVPSETLIYYPCFDGFECSRLSVPLDWMNPTDPDRAAIAIVKVPAEVPETDPSWGGPLLINPGGPGGSGVAMAFSRGRKLQQIVGKQFSILGFDPRGINNTTPRVSCFHTNVEHEVWGMTFGNKLLGSTQGGEEIGEAYSRVKALNEVCVGKIEGKGGDQVGTAVVARDMLAITERAWEAVGVKGEEKGLQYWGFSYGTVLGMVYAAMFPDRIKRLVVDGVVDTDDYFATGWLSNLQDLPLVLSSFSNYCSLAGPLSCKFHTGSTPEHITTRLQYLLDRISHLPISVPHTEYGPDIVTKADVVNYVFHCLYSPLATFTKLATILLDLENGDGRTFIEATKVGFSCACGGSERHWGEVSNAILCSDGVPINDTVDDFRNYVGELRGQADDIGSIWSQIRLGCVGWGVRPKWRFEGKLAANTSWPLLFIGNTADTVTPVRNARKMSQNYGGSVVLEQNSEGHCSISSPSVCTARHVNTYFATGELPPPGVVCETDIKPFGDVTGANIMNESWTEEEMEWWHAAKGLSEEWAPILVGLKV
ncbi:hypothetical protein RUND412_004758 [Rhizina undulata]